MPVLRALQYPNTTDGQRRKISDLQDYVGRGWTIASETITPGHLKGGQACCLAAICLPLGFAAGRDPGTINVTLQYDGADPSALAMASDINTHDSDCPHDWKPYVFFHRLEYCDRPGCNATRIVKH